MFRKGPEESVKKFSILNLLHARYNQLAQCFSYVLREFGKPHLTP